MLNLKKINAKKAISAGLLTVMTVTSLGALAPADARRHYTNDRRYYYEDSRRSWFDTKTGKIVKGSLIGAGVGAGAGLVLDKSVGKSALLGAGIGAGVQALRYSDFLDRR